jgi:dihydrodipicolinate synthase/N-acetylneuraminate lyase
MAYTKPNVSKYLEDTTEAGADVAAFLPAAYFGAATKLQLRHTPHVIESFFEHVAKVSSLPVILYSLSSSCRFSIDKIARAR